MIKGSAVSLHKGSVCYVSAASKPYDGDRCIVQAFEPSKDKWRVRLQGGSKELLIPESGLRLSFALQPTAPNKMEEYAKLSYEDTQGSCGRGLIVAQPVRAGLPLFEEPPLVVAFKDATSPKEHHKERWQAYATLLANARREQQFKPDGPLGEGAGGV